MTTQIVDPCQLLEEIGFAAVTVKAINAEVVAYNKLFALLVEPPAGLESARWFVECVRTRIAAADEERWETCFTNRTSVQVQVSLSEINGEPLDFEMRTVARSNANDSSDTILCIFVPLNSPVLERFFDAYISKGSDLERRRIRDELHKGVSQQLLGAAFACKVLACRLATLNEKLGKEAADVGVLLNNTVIDLQNLMRS